VGLPLDAGVIAAAVLGLALAAYFWWAFFTGDNERAEHALGTVSPESPSVVVLTPKMATTIANSAIAALLDLPAFTWLIGGRTGLLSEA
jgi:hypothetical protein